MVASVALGVAVLGTVSSIESQKKGQRAIKRQNKEQRRLTAISNARAKRQSLAEARRLRARTRADAAASGAVGSSAVQGSLSSISSQAAERVGFSNVQAQIGGNIAGFANDAARANTNAATASAIAGLGGQLGLIGAGADPTTKTTGT